MALGQQVLPQHLQRLGPGVPGNGADLALGHGRPGGLTLAARQAQQDGIVVSTMGLGLGFNEALLIELADASGGNAYFCQDPAEIPEVFEQELSSAQSITWRDVSLSLALPGDVTLRRALLLAEAATESAKSGKPVTIQA